MTKTPLRSLSAVQGIKLQGDTKLIPTTLSQLKAAIPLAIDLLALAKIGKTYDARAQAATAAIQTVTSLVALIDPKCDKAQPAEDIDTTTDSSGDLILRCRHNPYHKWTLGGKAIP
jgi:hypothetical protein